MQTGRVKGFHHESFYQDIVVGQPLERDGTEGKIGREPMCLEIVEGLDDQNRLGCIWDTMGYISCKHVHNIYIWRKPWFLFKIPSCDVRVQES